jgi:hypothetical protein
MLRRALRFFGLMLVGVVLSWAIASCSGGSPDANTNQSNTQTAGLIKAGWEQELPNESILHKSVAALVTRDDSS